MTSDLIIYTEKITPRIKYIFDFIFREFSGINFTLISNQEEFIQKNSAKINFSNHFFDQEINFLVDDILLENDIRTSINYHTLSPIGRCFYWLSRYEEYIAKPDQWDQHNRFLGSDLDYSQPIVDFICIEIQHQIKEKFPDIKYKERSFKQINTYDVDFAWKYLHHSIKIKYGSLFKKLLKGDLKNFKTQISVLNGKQDDPYEMYNYIENLAENKNIETIFFWLLGDYSEFDKNHSWKNKNQASLIQKLAKWANIGIHPSYLSNFDAQLQELEINRLEKILQKPITKSRQHFIKLNFPSTYQQLLTNGIQEDFTMGFAHQIGFRAGTCTPFKWFDLSTNQQSLLTVYPFVAMDVTMKNYLKLTPEEAILQLKQLKKAIKTVNGTFITLFHQSNLNDEWKNWRMVYESICND